jgi:hypothetical protein
MQSLQDEAVFNLFPVFAGLHQDSKTWRWQRPCCSLDAEAPDLSDDLDIPSIPCWRTQTELIPVCGEHKPRCT